MRQEVVVKNSNDIYTQNRCANVTAQNFYIVNNPIKITGPRKTKSKSSIKQRKGSNRRDTGFQYKGDKLYQQLLMMGSYRPALIQDVFTKKNSQDGLRSMSHTQKVSDGRWAHTTHGDPFSHEQSR